MVVENPWKTFYSRAEFDHREHWVTHETFLCGVPFIVISVFVDGGNGEHAEAQSGIGD